MTADLFSKKALIVGGSCRMALDLLPGLSAKGIVPIVTYRSQAGKDRIEAVADQHKDPAELIRLDFADRRTLANLDTCIDSGIDYLVDFAHGDYESLVAGADEDCVEAYFRINLSFRAAMLKKVARGMLARRRGRLVYISSTAAARSNPGQGFYAAAKLAAEALYRNLGLEMASKGIFTAVLRPGYIAAGRGRRYLDTQPLTARALQKAGQVIDSKDIAEGILFLLLQTGSGVNGSVLTIDGGLTVGK